MEKFIRFWEELFDVKNTRSSSENLKSDSVVEEKPKLKFRIKHFYKDHYTIEYSTGWGWEYIKYWVESDYYNGYEEYKRSLFTHEGAERFISEINSIDDINEYHKKELAKRDDFYRRQKEYLAKKNPYEERIIIKG